MTTLTDAEVFEEYRDLMFAVAYRMLGTIADAEERAELAESVSVAMLVVLESLMWTGISSAR